MPAVESVGGCVGAEQGGPGGPKFGTKSIVQPVPQGLKPRILYRTFARLSRALNKHNTNCPSDTAGSSTKQNTGLPEHC
jgi:hypothetical protein